MSLIEHLEIIFQNENFAVVNKPAEMLSVPGRFGEKDGRPVVGLLLEKQMNVQVFPVHRLDYEVGGILLFALNRSAHSAANSWFEQKKVQKVYHALTKPDSSFESLHEGETIEWKCKLLRGKKRAYESPAGKSSLTKGRFLGPASSNPRWHLWELEPVTGRSHQLRYELFRHHSPIVGDQLYGSQEKNPSAGIALRAIRLQLPAEASHFNLPFKFEIPGYC